MSIKTKLNACFLALFLGLIFASCESQEKDDSATRSITQQQEAAGIAKDLLGIYHGIQPAYHLKNEYGDEMIINGNPVAVPSIDFKFSLKEAFVVSLQQINLEDNSRVYYSGKFKVLRETDKVLVITCELHDGDSSNPTYTLTIDKAKQSATCAGGNEPEFVVKKLNN
jgi:hypothetical protein